MFQFNYGVKLCDQGPRYAAYSSLKSPRKLASFWLSHVATPSMALANVSRAPADLQLFINRQSTTIFSYVGSTTSYKTNFQFPKFT